MGGRHGASAEGLGKDAQVVRETHPDNLQPSLPASPLTFGGGGQGGRNWRHLTLGAATVQLPAGHQVPRWQSGDCGDAGTLGTGSNPPSFNAAVTWNGRKSRTTFTDFKMSEGQNLNRSLTHRAEWPV